MFLVDTGNAVVSLFPQRLIGQNVALTADEMSQGMTTKGIAAEKKYVCR